MAKIKLRRILGKRKPLRGILDAISADQTIDFRIESDDGTFLYGSEDAEGQSVDINIEGTCIGRIQSTNNTEAIHTVIARYLELEIEKELICLLV